MGQGKSKGSADVATANPDPTVVASASSVSDLSGGKRRKKRNNNNNGNGVLRSGYTFVAAELQIQCWSPSSANKAALQGWRHLTNILVFYFESSNMGSNK